MSRYVTLPHEELSVLVIQSRTDKKAAEAVFNAMTRYVRFILRMYCGRIDEDLLSAGHAGLWKAVQEYDPESGKFPHYAGWWIRKYAYSDMKTRKPKGTQELLSLDTTVKGSDVTLGDTIPDEDGELPDAFSESESDRRRVQRALAQLPEKMRVVVTARMHGASLEESVETFGLTRERARQIEEMAMRKLREILMRDQ